MRPWAPLSALLAAACALLALLGVGPEGARGAPRIAVLLDASPSCEAPAEPPAGAVRFRESDLAAALASVRPDAERIWLLTDGCDPNGPPGRLPPVPVDVTLLPRRDDLSLLAIEAPPRIAAGEEFLLRVTIGRTEGAGRGPAVVSVSLFRDGERVGLPVEASLAPGERRSVRFTDRVPEERICRYRAALGAEIGDAADDGIEAAVRIGDRPSALSVGVPLPEGFAGREVGPLELRRALADAAGALDAVLLGGAALPRDAQETLVGAVRAGMGLVLLAGPGYAGQPLEAVLPLTDRPPDGRAVCLLLDYSGSMTPRKEELNEAVARLKSLLHPDDRIAIVVFRDVAAVAAPWTTVREEGTDLRSFPTRYRTEVLRALELGRGLLAEARAARRRLYVVSDGEWTDIAPAAFPEKLRALEGEGIHARLLLVGGRSDPEAFREILRQAEREAPDRRLAGPFPAERVAPAAFVEAALPARPEWRDLVRLYPRDAGERIALACGGSPLLATLEPGGRVAMMASGDAEGAERLLRACARVRPTGARSLRAWREGFSIEAEGRGGGGATFRLGEATVEGVPSGPGARRARFERAPAEACFVLWEGVHAFVPSLASRELEGLAPRADVAAAIASGTGGRLLGPGERPPAPRDRARRPEMLLLAASGLLLVAAILRRSR